MSEEEKVEETTDEEIETLGEAGLESEEDRDAANEADVEEEKEEVDERGVSYKNVAAEMKRKLDAAIEGKEEYKELLTKLNAQKKEPTAPQIQELIDIVSDEEFEKENISSSTAALIRRAVQAGINKRENEINKEAKGLQERRKEQENERQAALHEVKSELSGEFGELFQENGNWDTSSKIFKRTCEIYNNSARLQGRATGQAEAARKAEMELMKEKYNGKAKPPKKTSKAESMKGGGSGRSGAKGGKIKDSNGEYYRELTDKEFDDLNNQEQTKYLVKERQFIKD